MLGIGQLLQRVSMRHDPNGDVWGTYNEIWGIIDIVNDNYIVKCFEGISKGGIGELTKELYPELDPTSNGWYWSREWVVMD